LIPSKNTAIAQGEHFFFDIDVKGREKEWSGLDVTVGGPNRLAQSFRVSINTKGVDCRHVYRKVCMSLMARSEYPTMEKQRQCKLRRDSAEVHKECKTVLVYLMENKQERKISSVGITAWKDQKCKLHFEVSDTGHWRSQGRNSRHEMPKWRNAKPQNNETCTCTRVSDTERLRSQESRLFNIGNPKSQNVKDSILEVWIPGVGDVKDFHDRKLEVVKCEKPKS
jgi:hypothetical protein